PVFGTHLPSVLHKGINGGLINLEKLVEVMCKNPAKILGVYPRKGTIIPGGDADLVIVELDKKKTVSPKLLGSRSDFSLFDGQELRGWPIMTIKGGKVIPI
ncbi:MAG: amidohydrolase family protein, partial [Acholeplasmataceae bacterium]|nr:amidohydrolase family protein [Acholeplasmataceae bacterium]